MVLDDETLVTLLVRLHARAPHALDLLPEHVTDLVGVNDGLALLSGPIAIRLAILALKPDAAEVLVFSALDGFVKSAHLVGDKELTLGHVVHGPGATQLLGDRFGRANAMFTRGHINIDNLHREPRSEDQEGDHGENTTDGRVISTIILVGKTDRLAEPIEFFEEFRVLVLRHYLK